MNIVSKIDTLGSSEKTFDERAHEARELFGNLLADLEVDMDVDGADEILVQLQETVENIDACRFSPEEKNIFLRLVGLLWKKYVGSDGNIERRKRKMSPHNGNIREPELNHALGVVQLGLQVLEEAYEDVQTLPPSIREKIKILWKGKFKLILGELFHDGIEDGKFTKDTLI